MKISLTISPIFKPKIGCHGNVPLSDRKEDQISHLQSNTYHTGKIW